MEVALVPRKLGHYRLPTASLTAFSLPSIAPAIREAQAQLFSYKGAGLVDHRGHSMLCREALQIGLVGDTCIELLRLYRNSYGLHRLTGAVLGRLGASFLTSGDDLFPQRAGLMKRLNTPSVDPVETASYAIAAIDAGLVELDAIAPHIETGPNGAGLTMAELQRSLIRRVKLPADAEGAFDFGIKDGHFILE